jgi:hypothetical protein
MTTKINENFNLNYSSREQNTNDTVLDCNVSFENPKGDDIIIYRLNTWLEAIGRDQIIVTKVNSDFLKKL